MVLRGLLSLALVLLPLGLSAQGIESGRPRVVVAELEGIIHPITAEFIGNALDRANEIDAAVAIIVLRTPGGLVDSTRAIVSRMIESPVPVAVFVGPSGARAASAGFILTIAADVAAMAPGTHIGAAHPVSGTDQQMDEVTSQKATADVAAYARSLAETRGRNVDLSAEAVTDSRAFTDREARDATPPLIDFVVDDVAALLTTLDGRTIRRFNGDSVTLQTAGAEIVRVEMTRRQQVLSAIAHPQIAGLLLALGVLGLTVELWNPGAIVPGVAGGLSLLLAFFAFQVLPVNTAGMLLILFGLLLLGAEIFVPSFGALGIGGTISLLAGATMVTGDVPGVRVGLEVIVPVVLTIAAITVLLGRLAVAAQRAPASTGVASLVGAEARTITPVGPDASGQVRLHGEIWRATSQDPLPADVTVRVTAVNGLTVRIERVAPGPRQEET